MLMSRKHATPFDSSENGCRTAMPPIACCPVVRCKRGYRIAVNRRLRKASGNHWLSGFVATNINSVAIMAPEHCFSQIDKNDSQYLWSY